MPSPAAHAGVDWLCHDLGPGSWTVDQAGVVVTRHSPPEQDECGRTPEEALTSCLI
jgi:hypothetical protein